MAQELFHQRCLTDSGLTRNEDDAARARNCLTQYVVQLPQLRFAANQFVLFVWRSIYLSRSSKDAERFGWPSTQAVQCGGHFEHRRITLLSVLRDGPCHKQVELGGQLLIDRTWRRRIKGGYLVHD